jgi:hypothetical protein
MLTQVSHWRAAWLSLLLVCTGVAFAAPAPPGPLLMVSLGEELASPVPGKFIPATT